MKKLSALVLFALLLLIIPSFAEYQVGDHVVDFTLPDTSGNPVSLYDYSDRIVIMPFWEAG